MSSYSCMRFESKHQKYKRLMHIGGNFKNVPKTVSTRHQHDVAFRMLRKDSSYSTVKVGRGTVVTLSDLRNGLEINKALSDIGLHFELFQTSWVSVEGTKYKNNCYLLHEMKNEMPQFVQVLEIFVRDQGLHVFFL